MKEYTVRFEVRSAPWLKESLKFAKNGSFSERRITVKAASISEAIDIIYANANEELERSHCEPGKRNIRVLEITDKTNG